jgi:Zn-dependent metalloprotease
MDAHTGELAYQGVPGALQENYADVGGVLFEQYSTGEMNWLFGEASPWGVVRNVADPPSLLS